MHLPQVTFRHPQAVALSVVLCILAGGTAGSCPSLHVDACASTLRPLSPYGPDKRGLPSFPRFPALRCCGSSGRKGNNVTQDRVTGGLAARGDYGGQRERSGIARAAIPPARSALVWPHGLSAACLSFMHMGLCPSARVDGKPSTSQQTLSVVIDGANIGRNWFGYPVSAKLTSQAGQDSAASFLRRFGRQAPACAGVQVFALFPHR